jgi:hypothetical protein
MNAGSGSGREEGCEGENPLKREGELFDTLILLGRPASGKSEIIEYLRRLEPAERRRLHLGELVVVDDFPMLWSWLEEDRLLSEMGKPRLYTDEQGYFKKEYLWDLLVRRLCLEHEKRKKAMSEGGREATVIIEFSRGGAHGGYRRALAQMSAPVLQAAVVLYVNVSFEESLRKNRRRYNPRAPHSILQHSLPDEKMRRLYGEDDWGALSAADPHFLKLQEMRLPYGVFENEEDFTTAGGAELGWRLEDCFRELWRLCGAGPGR